MKVGRHLELCTTELAFGYIEALERYPLLKDYRIVLIDTPGFDDTHKTDLEILVIFATWLKDWYVVPEVSKAK
jgi:hypothetical protein